MCVYTVWMFSPLHTHSQLNRVEGCIQVSKCTFNEWRGKITFPHRGICKKRKMMGREKEEEKKRGGGKDIFRWLRGLLGGETREWIKRCYWSMTTPLYYTMERLWLCPKSHLISYVVHDFWPGLWSKVLYRIGCHFGHHLCFCARSYGLCKGFILKMKAVL